MSWLSTRRFFLAWALPFVAFALVALFFPRRSVNLFPDPRATLTPISDSYSGGNSSGQFSLSDSVIVFDYRLDDQITYPYMGFRVNPGQPIDFTAFNEVRLRLTTDGGQRIPVFFEGPHYTLQDGRDLEVLLWNTLETIEGQEEYALRYEDFEVPSFWYRVSDVSEVVNKGDALERIETMRITGNEMDRPTHSGHMELRALTLVSNPNPMLWRAFYWLLGFEVFVLLIYLFLRKYRIQIVAIPYQPKEKASKQEEAFARIQAYLAEHYDQPITAEILRRETGIPRQRVADTVKKATGLTLKNLVNQVRLAEAKRLLRETDLPVIDIAFGVGYGTSAHFHRVFKEEEGVTPLAYRAQQIATP